MKMMKQARRIPVGAEVLPEGSVDFCVWAPRRKSVAVVIEGAGAKTGAIPLEVELSLTEQGYFSGLVAEARPGTRYRYRLGGGDQLYPDPASRFQPEGPHGSSCVIDSTRFEWTDEEWRGVRLEGQVIYEMHIGTFTQVGTWEGRAAS